MVNDVLNVGLAAIGVLGVVLAIAQALPSWTRVAQALTWLVPAVALWILVIVVSDVLVALVLALAAMGLYFAMMTSSSAQRWWLRTVLRSHDPWVLRDVPFKETSFLEQLSLSLRRAAQSEARLVAGATRTPELGRIARERSRISQLSPPDDRWADVLREAISRLDLVLAVYADADGPSAESSMQVDKAGMRLREHMYALRNDQPWPDQVAYEHYGR